MHLMMINPTMMKGVNCVSEEIGAKYRLISPAPDKCCHMKRDFLLGSQKDNLTPLHFRPRPPKRLIICNLMRR